MPELMQRFWKDAPVFDRLADTVLPELAQAAVARGSDTISVWSAGCAAGEEPYSVSIAWELAVAPRFPTLSIAILATDAEPVMLARARAAHYGRGSVRDLPPAWRDDAFVREKGELMLRPQFRANVRFQLHDLRKAPPPPGPFDAVLCRNLAFSGYSPDRQRKAAEALLRVLRPGGALVIGAHEHLPPETALEVFEDVPCTWRRPESGFSASAGLSP